MVIITRTFLYDPFPLIQKELQNLPYDAVSENILTKMSIISSLPITQIFIFSIIYPKYTKIPIIHLDDPLFLVSIAAQVNFPNILTFTSRITWLPSFLKDSNNLIRILKTTRWEEGLCYLTMDVTSLYSNMEHNFRLKCIEFSLKNDKEIITKQIIFIYEAIHFILNHNFFTYGGTKKREWQWGHRWHVHMPTYLWGTVRMNI